jgi:hypothetical protein
MLKIPIVGKNFKLKRMRGKQENRFSAADSQIEAKICESAAEKTR